MDRLKMLRQLREMQESLDKIPMKRRKMEEQEYSFELPSPFSDAIIRAPLPAGFELPSIDRYDGTTDPEDHLESFKAKMILWGRQKQSRAERFHVPCRTQR